MLSKGGGTSRSWPFSLSLFVQRLRNGAEDTSCTSLIRASRKKKKIKEEHRQKNAQEEKRSAGCDEEETKELECFHEEQTQAVTIGMDLAWMKLWAP